MDQGVFLGLPAPVVLAFAALLLLLVLVAHALHGLRKPAPVRRPTAHERRHRQDAGG